MNSSLALGAAVATWVAAAVAYSGGAADMPTLSWMGRDKATNATKDVVLKILREDRTLSYRGDVSHTEPRSHGDFENVLVHGDNLEALKALLPFYAGQVKCIYIDPPYNTGSAFEHYDDNLEHATWLNLMYPRLRLLRDFLREDGSIWISIDDDEQAYLKVMCDEIFGRKNFVATVVWQKRTSPDNRLRLGDAHDYILVYQKVKDKLPFNQVPMSEERVKGFKNPDNDPRGPWASTDCTAQAGHGVPSQFYVLTTPAGREITLPKGLCWRFTKERFEEEIRAGRIWFGKDGKGVPRKKTYLADRTGQNCWTWWTNTEVGHNQEAKKEVNALFENESPFDTPKPERLVKRILEIATDPGDLVLDSFLGSGTTAAVAHKMGRRWIGIEMGEHAKTHCAVRLRKVVDGEQGGISKSVKWPGGGGFRYYDLGEPLLDENGQIAASIPFDVLAAHVWWSETGTGWNAAGGGRGATALPKSPVLGVHDGVAYALLYNGILKDRRVDGGNVLTRKTLALIKEDLEKMCAGGGRGATALPNEGSPQPHSIIRLFDDSIISRIVVFGEWNKLGAEAVAAEKIEFRQTPYDIVTRR